ncbi:MAG: hypothetical protein ACOY0T_37125 [Myxococcota bacterium]
MRKLLRIACAFAAGLVAEFSGCTFRIDESAAETVRVPPSRQVLSATIPSHRAAIALRWAPIHYQDVQQIGSHALGGRADYVTRYDFDGDLNAANNWDRTGDPAYPLAAHAYYSVVETSSHWFIVYMFFHPRDWSQTFFDTEHENDAEGVLVNVARDGSTYGSLKSIVTVAHRDFFSYVPQGSGWQSGAESVDGKLTLESYQGGLHPVTAQEAEGHGLKARPHYDIHADGVVYYPSLTTAEVPSGPNDRRVLYRLIDIFEPGGLYDNRDNPSLFSASGTFVGNSSGGCGRGVFACTANSANPPWGWDDSDDARPRGALALDPARLVRNYFNIPEACSTRYTFNPYVLSR